MTTKINVPDQIHTEWVHPPMNFGWMFEEGQKGLAYKATVSSGLYQDDAVTSPVTTAGQGVAYMVDLSGNNNPILSLSGQRPLWQHYAPKNVDGIWGNGSSQKAYTRSLDLLNGASAITIMMAAVISTDSTTVGPLLRIQATTGFEPFIDITPNGISVKRVAGEAAATSGAIYARGESFLLTLRINFSTGTMELRKNGSFISNIPLTSSGVSTLLDGTLTLFSDLPRTIFCRGFIHELAIVDEWIDNDMVLDYEDKFMADAKM